MGVTVGILVFFLGKRGIHFALKSYFFKVGSVRGRTNTGKTLLESQLSSGSHFNIKKI